jgi:hypothetical protein
LQRLASVLALAIVLGGVCLAVLYYLAGASSKLLNVIVIVSSCVFAWIVWLTVTGFGDLVNNRPLSKPQESGFMLVMAAIRLKRRPKRLRRFRYLSETIRKRLIRPITCSLSTRSLEMV